MTTTLDAVKAKNRLEPSAEAAAATELVRLAKEKGWSLTGPDGLLKQLTKTVLQTALNEEMTEHLGYERHDVVGRDSGNIRGRHPRQDGADGVDEIVLSLYAKGLTTGEISAHFQEIYGAPVSKETISRITDKSSGRCRAGSPGRSSRSTPRCSSMRSRVKIRDGQVTNRPIYAAIGVTLDGEKDILGLWAGTGGEGAKFWMGVLTDIRNRGTRDVFFLVCDGLKGLPEVVGNVWPLTTVQTCIIHLIRNTFRLASRKDWDALKRDVKPIYTAVNAAAARAALEDLTDRWGKRYPALIQLWDNAWEEFIPFIDARHRLHPGFPADRAHAHAAGPLHGVGGPHDFPCDP